MSTQHGRKPLRDLNQTSNTARAKVVSKDQVSHQFGEESGRLLEMGRIGKAMIQAGNVMGWAAEHLDTPQNLVTT